MFLSALLTKEGFKPVRIQTTATVHLGDGPTITLIELKTVAEVPGLIVFPFLIHYNRV